MAIRPESDPRNAAPQAPTQMGELEQYGVWVKAEPQDIVEEAQPSHGEMDFELSGESADIPEESFLSEDEEKLLGSFDSEFDVDSEKAPSDSDFGILPDIEEIPSLDESLLDPEALERGAAAIDLDLSTPMMEEESASPRQGMREAPHDFATFDAGEFEEPPRAARQQPRTETPMPKPTVSSEMEDVSAEFLDIPAEDEQPKGAASLYRSAKAVSREPAGPGPATASASPSDVTAEFLDIDESVPGAQSPESITDFETLDIDLHFDDTLPPPPESSPASAPAAEEGFEEVTDFDDFLSAGSAPLSRAEEAELMETAQPAAKPEERPSGRFDDVAAVEMELGEEEETPKMSAAHPSASKPDLSTEILLKIADELSSIRGELISLRTALSDIKTQAAPAPAAEASEAESAEVPAGGFFDEEEDETIALTGDELDNILNTADFTEVTVEPGEPSELELEAAALMPPEPPSDSSLLSEDILPESGVYESREPPIEEIRLSAEKGSEPGISAIPIDSLETPAREEFRGADEDLVRPMTEAPEDTSFLEGETVEELGSPELGDVPLVEPDLSDFDLEAEELELEPRPEIEEELPLAEVGAEAVEEIPILQGAEEPLELEEVVEEAEFLEPLAEIEEEPSFGEIDLHTELPAAGKAAAKPQEPEIEEPKRAEPPSPAPAREAKAPAAQPAASDDRLKTEIRSVLSYLDKLLDSLPEEKIEEFARSEYFDTYKRLFEELGLV